MAAVSSATGRNVAPEQEKKHVYYEFTADSADTIDVGDDAVVGSDKSLDSIDALYCYDQTSGDQVTATFSGTVVTVDAAGGTTSHVYCLVAWGDR